MGIRKKAPEGLDPKALLDMLPDAPAGEVLHYACRLVTPMYGGGVEAGIVDAGMPIRATAIRGQLRFWWRLLNRRDAQAQARPSEELFKLERAIWGGLGDGKSLAASKVLVRVKSQPKVTEKTLLDAAIYESKDGRLKSFPDFGSLPAYVLFPAQGKVEQGALKTAPAKLLDAGARWNLAMGLDPKLREDQRAQVREALAWWATFGGVGARTRRGCGAVEVKDANGARVCIYHAEIERHGFSLHLRKASAGAVDAWREAVAQMKEFRQGKGIGRHPGNEPNRPGRSFWPEPDAIRRITGSHASKHAPEHLAGDCFPRAAFGLPIIFHFKDPEEPTDTTLKPRPDDGKASSERMASPIILRPYPAIDGGWHPAALCLDRSHVQHMGLSLEGKARNLPKTLSNTQWPAGSKAMNIRPMAARGDDVLAAFLAYFTEGQGVGVDVAQAAAAPPPPEEEYFRAQINIRGNGSVIAKNTKTNKESVASGADAKTLATALSAAARKAIDNGRFIATAVLLDGKLIRIEEIIK